MTTIKDKISSLGNDTAAPTTRKVVEAAHGLIDNTATHAESVEQQLRTKAHEANAKVSASQEAASEQIQRSIGEVETFAKERPFAAAGIAFAAGVLATAILRR